MEQNWIATQINASLHEARLRELYQPRTVRGASRQLSLDPRRWIGRRRDDRASATPAVGSHVGAPQ